MNTKYFIIVNNFAGSNRVSSVWPQISTKLDQQNVDYVSYFTEYPGHATILAKNILENIKISDQVNQVILSIGGDGTLHEVVNGCFQYYQKYPLYVYEKIPLAYIPLGTGNDFARGAHISKNWTTALNNILNCTFAKPIAVGKFTNNLNQQTGVFVNNFGIGFDASVVKVTNQSKNNAKFSLGKFSYIINILSVLRSFDSFKIHVIIGKKLFKFDRAYLATVSNHPFFGGGVKILPSASIFDDNLDMIVIENPNFLKLAYIFLTLPFGLHTKAKFVHRFHTDQLYVYVSKEQTIQIDGEDQSNQLLNVNFTVTQYPFWMN